MAKANVTIIEAPMGEGKTVTVTGIVVDDYFAHITGIQSPSGIIYSAQPYKGEIIRIFPQDGDESKSKLIKVPDGWEPLSDTKIFANYHLFGVRSTYCDATMMLDHLNTEDESMKHAKMILDESYIQGEARRPMGSISLMYTWFAQQMRKRDIELFLLVQHGRFLDWRFRYIAKRKILCRYNEKTHIVKLLVQNLSKGTEKPFSYWAPQYWKYYDTNELPPIPDAMIERARKSAV